MKRILLGLALMGSFAAKSQDSGFSGGLDLSVPMGDFGELFSFGVGPAVQYDVEMGDKGLLGGSLSYQFLAAKEDVVSKGWMFNLMAHYKFFFSEVREGFYLAAMVGYGGVNYSILDESNQGDMGTSIAPMLGIVVGERIDVGLRYHMIFGGTDGSLNSRTGAGGTGGSSYSFVGLRGAYYF